MPEREELISELKRRFAKNFLDMVVLNTLRVHPTWGYKMLNRIQKDFGINVGYSVIYPLLNSLERRGLIKGRTEFRGKRGRKVYRITPRGVELVRVYHELLREQMLISKVIL